MVTHVCEVFWQPTCAHVVELQVRLDDILYAVNTDIFSTSAVPHFVMF
jgi:hypothetical protein